MCCALLCCCVLWLPVQTVLWLSDANTCHSSWHLWDCLSASHTHDGRDDDDDDDDGRDDDDDGRGDDDDDDDDGDDDDDHNNY